MATSQVTVDSGFLVAPAGGKVVMQGPLGVLTKIPGTKTNGVISIVEHPVAPRLLVPPHVHQDHDEWWRPLKSGENWEYYKKNYKAKT